MIGPVDIKPDTSARAALYAEEMTRLFTGRRMLQKQSKGEEPQGIIKMTIR